MAQSCKVSNICFLFNASDKNSAIKSIQDMLEHFKERVEAVLNRKK